jgi:hydrogenase maturation protein HypF
VDHERRAIRVTGVVQGVGFRPAMHSRLANELRPAGLTRNDSDGVFIEVEGAPMELDRFSDRLTDAEPGVAKADRAACADCLCELLDPRDRRYRYPFINCTACGPRYTIIREGPYDRERTTMAAFVMCSDCRREYEDPYDRRFHAEPNSCPACGPIVRLVDATGRELAIGDTAIREAADTLERGGTVAVKGAGGFVLAADATSERAVSRLRQRKRRPRKPFAVMGRGLRDIERIAILDDAARAALMSPIRPIVVAPSRGAELAPSIAPGLADVGVCLPPTPLQYLLLGDGPCLQVVTSGNFADEPIARTDSEARSRLGGVVDLFLLHDREIHARADDSVVRSSARGMIPIRRARGFVPDAIQLPVEGPPLVAVGGHGRTVCMVHDGRAVMSPDVHSDSDEFFCETIAQLEKQLGVSAAAIAHDLHPGYLSTRWAKGQALPLVAVQHHHAHVAACLAEHGRCDRVVGIAFDGAGLGDDGTSWGGEVLSADLATSRRVGHLRPLALPGGDAAVGQPWRLAAAALIDAGESTDVLSDVSPLARAQIESLLATNVAARGTGAGRWFDAVAAILGIARSVSYHGQAAAELEAYAEMSEVAPLDFVIVPGDPFEIDFRPAVRELVRELRRGTAGTRLAARFHATMCAAIVAACWRVGAPTVVLTGGCFQNRRLCELASGRLESDGFEVLTHRSVPPNDGGLALGQAAIASFRLAGGSRSSA